MQFGDRARQHDEQQEPENPRLDRERPQRDLLDPQHAGHADHAAVEDREDEERARDRGRCWFPWAATLARFRARVKRAARPSSVGRAAPAYFIRLLQALQYCGQVSVAGHLLRRLVGLPLRAALPLARIHRGLRSGRLARRGGGLRRGDGAGRLGGDRRGRAWPASRPTAGLAIVPRHCARYWFQVSVAGIVLAVFAAWYLAPHTFIALSAANAGLAAAPPIDAWPRSQSS